MKKRLENNCYKMIHEFAADAQLCFDNAILYNGDGSDVSKVAKEMKLLFEKEFAKLMASIDLEEEQARGRWCDLMPCACSLCDSLRTPLCARSGSAAVTRVCCAVVSA